MMRSIRPFIGTEMDPLETQAEEKRYGDEMEPMKFF